MNLKWYLSLFYIELLNHEIKRMFGRRVLDDLSSDVNDEDDKYGYSNLLIARAGVASSRAEDLIAKKDN